MNTAIEITQALKNCYDVFINRLMQSTGLPFSEMQTLHEWVSNRFVEFNNLDAKDQKIGFENWLSKRYD
jgi:hypothetical protein